jgi:MFS family permease
MSGTPGSGRFRPGNAWPIVAGQAISLLGDYVALLALPLFVLDLTGSALDLGLTTAFETLPTLLFGFFAGVALDRFAIKRALIIADLGRAGAFAALAIAVAGDVAEVWMVFLAAFLVGSLGVLFDSGLQAWLPALLPETSLVVMNTRLQFVRTVAWTIGPPIAGYLIAQGGGFEVAFAFDAATFMLSVLFVLLLREVRPRPAVEHQSWWSSFQVGIRFLWGEHRLRTATIAATIVNFTFVPMEALLVLFASARLDITEEYLIGWFFAGHALLGALGVVAAPRLARHIGLGRTFVLGLTMLGGGFLVLTVLATPFAALPPAGSTLAAIVPAGVAVAGVSFTNVAFTTLRQQLPPPDLLGRVISASRTISWAGIPVGAALGGRLAEAYGVPSVYAVSSLVLLVTASAVAFSGLWRVSGAPAEPPRRTR